MSPKFMLCQLRLHFIVSLQIYRFMKKKKPKGAEDGKDAKDDEQGLVDGEQVEAEEVCKKIFRFFLCSIFRITFYLYFLQTMKF